MISLLFTVNIRNDLKGLVVFEEGFNAAMITARTDRNAVI